jgi:hypothetical protein
VPLRPAVLLEIEDVPVGPTVDEVTLAEFDRVMLAVVDPVTGAE